MKLKKIIQKGKNALIYMSIFTVLAGGAKFLSSRLERAWYEQGKLHIPGGWPAVEEGPGTLWPHSAFIIDSKKDGEIDYIQQYSVGPGYAFTPCRTRKPTRKEIEWYDAWYETKGWSK